MVTKQHMTLLSPFILSHFSQIAQLTSDTQLRKESIMEMAKRRLHESMKVKTDYLVVLLNQTEHGHNYFQSGSWLEIINLFILL